MSSCFYFKSSTFPITERRIPQRFWLCDLTLDLQKTNQAVHLGEHLYKLALASFTGGFTRHEHQADGPDTTETGVHGSPPV